MQKKSPLGVALAAGLLLLPVLANAQTWVPGPRQLSVYTGYQYLDVSKHLFSLDIPPEFGGDGTNGLDLGDIKGQTALFGFDYGIADRMAVSGSIAYVASKYDGVEPESAELDDGSWNRGFQDVSVGFRYMAVRAPIVITPSVMVSLPSHSYETLGHTALGRNLNEFRMGLNLGWVGRRVLPGVYLQGGYTYSVVEAVAVEGGNEIRPNRSDMSFEAGYFITPKLVVRGDVAYSHTHDGLDWAEDLVDESHFHAHDQAAIARFTSVGGGVSYSFGPSSVGIGVVTTVSGENTHDSTGIIVSLSRTFNLAR